MTESFWVIPTEPGQRTPYTILSEQGSALRQQTNGNLYGSVRRDITSRHIFILKLEIVVPSLNYYTYHLLTVSHGLETYPLELDFHPRSVGFEIENEADFVSKLKELLGGPETQKIVTALLAQLQ